VSHALFGLRFLFFEDTRHALPTATRLGGSEPRKDISTTCEVRELATNRRWRW
jgi:hypothetical protein